MGLRQGPNGKLIATEKVYEGDFHHDLPHGAGRTLHKKAEHTGEYKDGFYHGHGTLHDRDTGNIHTGLFCNGLKHGPGTLTNANTEMHVQGTWEDDRMTGPGTAVNLPIKSFNLSLGYAPQETPLSQYENMLSLSAGQLSQSVLSLQASILTLQQFHSGRYTGPIFNGKPQGINEGGVCTYEDSAVYKGLFKNGRRNGFGSYEFPTGQRYEGKFVGDKRSGNGRLHGPHGLEYDGLWQDNAPTGVGLLFDYEAGVCYEGQFKAGLKNGTGVMRDLKYGKVVYDGQWVHGHPMVVSQAVGGEGLSPSMVSAAVSGETALGKTQD